VNGLKAIFNASPIIAILDEVATPELFDLLRELDWELLVPKHVYRQEITKPPGSDLLRTLVSRGVLSELDDPPSELISKFLDENPDLEAGESCVLLCCIRLKEKRCDVIAVLDEGPARAKAQSLAIPLVGTIGILNLLEKRNLISADEASQLRRTLASSTFRVGHGLLRKTEDRVA
jgi:predicted nucleic acid-binding protein